MDSRNETLAPRAPSPPKVNPPPCHCEEGHSPDAAIHAPNPPSPTPCHCEERERRGNPAEPRAAHTTILTGLPRRPLREPPRNDNEKKRKAWIATPKRARNDKKGEALGLSCKRTPTEMLPNSEHTRIASQSPHRIVIARSVSDAAIQRNHGQRTQRS
jgi:hypothetical protein